MKNNIVKATANYYQKFDANYSLDVPAEGFGGWKRAEIELDLSHTAVVVMHAWDCGTREQYPGLYRTVEYIPRANEIVRTVFPTLLGAVRRSGMRLYHVVGGNQYYRQYPGFQRASRLAGTKTVLEQVAVDSGLEKLRRFRSDVTSGRHNMDDCAAASRRYDFPPEAKPEGDEGVAEDAAQLFALCKADGVSHLIYAGFAINMCLLMVTGGMVDMSRHGLMCSALRQAVTATENRESARNEAHKEEALWRVAIWFGFVFDVDDFTAALRAP